MKVERSNKNLLRIINLPEYNRETQLLHSKSFSIDDWKEFVEQGNHIVAEIEAEQREPQTEIAKTLLECRERYIKAGGKLLSWEAIEMVAHGMELPEKQREMVEMRCHCCGGRGTVPSGDCGYCDGIGKILRPMTEEEKAMRKLGKIIEKEDIRSLVQRKCLLDFHYVPHRKQWFYKGYFYDSFSALILGIEEKNIECKPTDVSEPCSP